MVKIVTRFIADLRFAIMTLISIITLSIIGTIIEQDQSIEHYKLNYPLSRPVLGFITWDFIIRFKLDHIYITWVFLIFLFMFSLSLWFCTLFQQFPTLKIARRCQFFRKLKLLNRLQICKRFNNFSITNLMSNLKKKKYSIFQQKNTLYCYKGLVGKISPVIVHMSIILILLGAFYSSIFGFKAQEILLETETFSIQNLLNNPYTQLLPKISTRINDFWITYNNFKISQFYSNISILNLNGNEVQNETISVNYPYNYNNVTFYQTDWSFTGLRIKTLQNYIYQYPLLKLIDTKNMLWLCWTTNFNQNNEGIILLLDNLKGYISIYTENGKLIANLEVNESWQLIPELRILDVISSTGIQIKTDPGLPLIYTGFFLLIISTGISYITYSQIWILKSHDFCFVGGNTSRAIFNFELEFIKLTK